MKQGDKYYRTRSISQKLDVITILDKEPELEYMLRVKYQDGKKGCINRAVLDKKWKPMTAGIQQKLFSIDKTDKYTTLFKKL